MSEPEKNREPCPDRIIDDAGGAFAMGLGGSSIYYYITGARQSEKGQKIKGGFQSIRMNAAMQGGKFAVWGGLFSTFDCTMVYLRQKEDPWNSIMAGGLTGGILQMRKGFCSCGKSAVIGACLLAMIEGGQIMVNNLKDKLESAGMLQQQQQRVEEASSGGGGSGYEENQLDKNLDVFLTHNPPLEQTNSKVEGFSSWFGGLFGSSRNKEIKAEVLESFDIPTPPLPNFDYK